MNFDSPVKIASVIDDMKTAELRRAGNRTLINQLFNGWPPYSKAEVQENKIQWNVNWGEGPDLLLQAREQLLNAHTSTDYFFTVRLPDGPPSKKSGYEQKITAKVNKLMKENLIYYNTQRSKWGSVALHGPGTQSWEDKWKWRPFFVAIDDLLIPTDTDITYEGMNHFAIRRRMSCGQLFRKTFGLPENKRSPGWKMDAVKNVLAKWKDVNQGTDQYNWFDNPEKMAEVWKQNSMYYDSDKVPKIWMWDFYHQEDYSSKPCWFRDIILDQDSVEQKSSDTDVTLLFREEKPFADNLGQILHTQFIDGNNVPPFMYHSCRGVGNRLFDICHAMNRLRNQSMQKTMEDLMLLFRADDPVDRARLDQIYLGLNYGIMPAGLSFVTRDQRYQIDPNMLENQLSQLKQLMGEGSQQYTQDIDTGTNKERTAFEVNALLNQTTRLTGSMLNLTYIQEEASYREICRRLMLPDTLDWDAKKLQNELEEEGVPKKWLDASRWEVKCVRVLGAGNTQLEQGQAQALLNIKPLLNPMAQNQVLNRYVYSVTHDPALANDLAPLDAAPPMSDSVADTERVFGALLAGSKVRPKPGLIAADVATTMINEIEAKVAEIMQMGSVGTPQLVMGLRAAEQYSMAYIQQLAQDKEQKQLVKLLMDKLGKTMNEVKAMEQRQQQMIQEKRNGNGADPEVMQKLMADRAMTQQKLQSKQASDSLKLRSKQAGDIQKLRSKEQSHAQGLRQKAQDFALQQQIDQGKAVAEIHTESMKGAIEAARQKPEESEE